MTSKPIIKGYKYFYNENELIFYNEDRVLEINGNSTREIIKILPYLNGTFTLEEISIKSNQPIELVEQIFNVLKNKELVKIEIEESISVSNESLNLFNFLSQYCEDLNDVLKDIEQLKNTKVGVIGDKKLIGVIEKKMNSLFQLEGFCDSNNYDFVIAIGFSEDYTLYEKLNNLSIQRGFPFLRGVLNANSFSVGPIFEPFNTCCYECFIGRITSNSNPILLNKIIKNEKEKKINEEPIRIMLGAIDLFLGNIMMQCIKYNSTILQTDILGKEYNFSFSNLESSLNNIYKIPLCRICHK